MLRSKTVAQFQLVSRLFRYLMTAGRKILGERRRDEARSGAALGRMDKDEHQRSSEKRLKYWRTLRTSSTGAADGGATVSVAYC